MTTLFYILFSSRDNERLDANENNYKIDAWAPFVERAVVSLLRGAYTTLMSECNGITSSICELFWNKTALFAENVKNVVINDELGNPTRVFDDNGDGIAGYNIYSVAFAGDSIYESVSSLKIFHVVFLMYTVNMS